MSLDVIALWLGWLLVWTLGAAIAFALYRRFGDLSADRGGMAFVIGAGWFVGQFALTLWMRLLSFIHVPFGVAPIAGPLALVAAALAWDATRHGGLAPVRRARDAYDALRGVDLDKAPRALWLALLGWLAFRFALLLLEVLRRPLYPWDAWTQWATKARVWFELRRIVPFGSEAAWLAAPAGTVYYDAAPNYPGTVPLTQVWSATLLRRFDDALVNLPWWLTGVAFAFALYGFLRRRGMKPLTALVGAWLVVSLPILDTHVALAGYADLAMATYFTLTALSALRYVRTRSIADLVLALVLAVACVLIKSPGKVWIATLVPGLIVASSPRHGLRIAGAFFAVALAAALVLTRTGITLLGYHLQLDFDMPWGGLWEAYFAFANWHLLFYGAIAVAIIGFRELLSRDLAPLTIVVAAGVAFLLFGFAFTNARVWVEDQSTVNRATLHLAPLIVIWMVTTFDAWARTFSRADESRRAVAAAA
ncbi:MAG TPA: hypothetical protein VJ891_09960 [Casimicrobiaceae bacterium]|nr:hypothetical protein [Casimicrobiaceae bacterium]